MNEWNIQSRAHVCQACEKRFVDKEPYHTLLLTSRDELQRQDICQACWTANFAKGITERKGYVSHWQALYHAPAAAPVEAIQKENAESLLRKLIEANDPKRGPACYILAVMLERKRLLKIKEQFKRDGVRVFIYEQPKSGDLFTISDPDLQLNQLEEVQRDVADLLANGLPPSAVAPAPAPATEPEVVPPAAESAAPDGAAIEAASPVIETTVEASEPAASVSEAGPPEPATHVSEETSGEIEIPEPAPDSQPESLSDAACA